MNGYDYLYRVLELYVPGFDPVLAIKTPRWEDSDDIFHFTQAYLLYNGISLATSPCPKRFRSLGWII